MIPEHVIQLLIYIHASLGGLALLTGFISIVAKKGGLAHRRSGIVFVISMLLSATVSMVVAVQPTHKSYFLICIGIFSMYFVFGGYRALRYKKPGFKLWADVLVSISMLLAGIIMVAHPLIFNSFSVVLTVFGIVGLVFSIQDLALYRKPEVLTKNWLMIHLGKITGGYISAVTAFVVVNQFIPGIAGWLAPGVIGTFYIVYWTRKVKQPK